MVIGFLQFATILEENTFFGPNTFKFTIALSSAIFVLLLTAHYDSEPGSSASNYVEELTGTVIYDLIDTVSGSAETVIYDLIDMVSSNETLIR